MSHVLDRMRKVVAPRKPPDMRSSEVRVEKKLELAAPAQRPPSVVILLIDTLRYDHAGLIPAFDILGEHGITFERIYGGSTFTYPNVCTLRSGLYPKTHGWRTWPHAYPPIPKFRAETTLTDCLRDAGYHISNTMAVPLCNDHRRLYRPKREPFFRFCWYMHIHDSMFRAGIPSTGIPPETYRRQVNQARRWIAEAVEMFSDSLIFLFGDHGIGLAGDKLRDEGPDVGAGQIYDFRIRIPAVLAGPGVEPRHIPGASSLADIMPTMLDILGLPIPPDLDGYVAGQRNEPVLLEAQSPYSIWPSQTPNVFGATDGRLKIMVTPDGVLCFDLHGDPAEEHNRPDLLATRPGRALLEYVAANFEEVDACAS